MTDFSRWCAVMGFNGKQIGAAGKAIGIEPPVASHTNTGKRDLTYTERLAMSAVRAGLEPWTPDTDAEPAAVAAILELIRNTKPPNKDDTS